MGRLPPLASLVAHLPCLFLRHQLLSETENTEWAGDPGSVLTGETDRIYRLFQGTSTLGVRFIISELRYKSTHKYIKVRRVVVIMNHFPLQCVLDASIHLGEAKFGEK